MAWPPWAGMFQNHEEGVVVGVVGVSNIPFLKSRESEVSGHMAASLALLCLLESDHATIRQKAQLLHKFSFSSPPDSHLSKKVEEKTICQFNAGVCPLTGKKRKR